MKKDNNQNNQSLIFIILLIFSIIITSICYAQVAVNLEVEGEMNLKKQADIAITNVKVLNNNSNVNIENYNRTTLTTDIDLGEDKNSLVELEITITNLSNKKKIYDGMLYSIDYVDFYSNSNIIPSTNLTENSTTINNLTSNNNTITFTLTFKYQDKENISNTNLKSTINFHFTDLINITYNNFNDTTNLKKEIKKKPFTNKESEIIYETIEFNEEEIPNYVLITSNDKALILNEDYTYNSNQLTFLTELPDDITITKIDQVTNIYSNTFNLEINDTINPNDYLSNNNLANVNNVYVLYGVNDNIINSIMLCKKASENTNSICLNSINNSVYNSNKEIMDEYFDTSECEETTEDSKNSYKCLNDYLIVEVTSAGKVCINDLENQENLCNF